MTSSGAPSATDELADDRRVRTLTAERATSLLRPDTRDAAYIALDDLAQRQFGQLMRVLAKQLWPP
ncbi:MAG: hypothetical protein AAGC55_04145, partial [Myxococcota bacterium]